MPYLLNLIGGIALFVPASDFFVARVQTDLWMNFIHRRLSSTRFNQLTYTHTRTKGWGNIMQMTTASVCVCVCVYVKCGHVLNELVKELRLLISSSSQIFSF